MCDIAENFQRIADSTKNSTVKKIFTILAKGEAQLCNSSKSIPHQATVVLGKASAGRSTFTRWIAGQDSKFVSFPDDNNPGEYEICDPVCKTPPPPPESVPVLVSSSKADSFYYDFPALADPRGVAYDIASTYFTKKVIQSVPSVKMCFLIEHNMMTSFGNPDDLLDFLRHIIELIGDIDRFDDSVLLVASKVPNGLSDLPDNKIIDAMVRFMQKLRQVLVTQSEQDKVDNSKMIKLLDLFMTTEQSVYPRLALFRSPNQPGPISNISLLQENKARVKEELAHLSYAQSTGHDFGYTITKSSFYDIGVTMEDIRNDIVDDVRASGQKIQQYFAAEETKINGTDFDIDLTHVYGGMKSGYEKMLAIRTLAGESDSLTQCIHQIIDGVANMTDNSVKLDLSSTLDSAEALDFFHAIVDGPRQRCTWFVSGLADTIQYLDDSQKWYLLAKRLLDRLLNCDLSRDLGTYNITAVDLDKTVSETNLKAFLLRYPQEQLYYQYEDVKGVVLTEFKLVSAQRIANLTTEYRKTNLLCSPDNSTEWDGPSIGDLYGTRGYLNDLYLLEHQFYRIQNRTSYLPYYQSLHTRVEEYIKKRASSNETSYFGDYTALTYLQMATLSRIRNIGDDLDNYLVVDLDGYFTVVKEHIDNYKQTLKNVQIDDYKMQYENTTNTQIVEAYAVLESISSQMDDIYVTINDEIAHLIDVVDELEKEGEEKEKELYEERNKLASQLPLKALVGVLQVASASMNFFGPIGEVASAAGGLISSTADGYITAGENAARSMIDGAKKFSDDLNNVYQRERTNLQDNLLNIDKINEAPEVMELIAEDEDYKNVANHIDDLVKKLDDNSLSENDYWQEKQSLKDVLTQYYNHLQHEQQKEEAEKKKKNALEKWTDRGKTAINLAEAGINAITDFEKSKDLISKIDNAIHDVDETIGNLKDYEHNLRDQLMPEIDTIQANMADVLKNSAHKSHAVLDKYRWTLQNMIADFKDKMDFMLQIPTPGSHIKQTIMTCIDKLLGGMTTSIEIYDRIQDYEDQKKLADYIANLNSNTNPDDDPSLNKDLEQLELLIKSNLVLQEYQISLGTFKQYFFPFVNSFLDHFDISPYLKPRDTNDLMSRAEQQISQLKSDLALSSATIGKLPDTIFFHVQFNVADVDQKPFFVWRHESYDKKISKLLQGREITLTADITQIGDAGNAYLNGVKFNEIGIRFLLPNKTMENELHELMSHFLITLIHMGDSHYRCDNEYYVFDHNLIKMTHSVNTFNDSNNKPYYDYKDETSEKVNRNVPIFSPYAAWKIQLQNRSAVPNHDDENFKQLEPFQHQPIDMALEGRGGHVEFPAKSCKNDLQKYYKLSGTFSTSSPSYNYYRNDPNATFETNSANGLKSPINNAINWLAGTLGYLKPFWMADEIIKDGFRSIFAHSKSFDANPTDDYSSAAATSAKFNVFESLTLADFLIRWMTKVKPHHNGVDESANSIETTAYVLNLVEKVENLIQSHSPDESAEQLDSLALISRLEKELRNNQNPTAVENILYQAVVDASPTLDCASFNDHIRQKITEMVPQRGREQSA